ncbi:SdpI family protein [soil metagenome]
MKHKLAWLEAALLAAPFLVLLAIWRELPARIPIHWNLAGEVDRWSGDRFSILGLPLLSVGVVVLCHFLPRLDPKLRTAPQEGTRMPTVLKIMRPCFAALFCVIFALQLAVAFGHSVSATRVFLSSVLLLLAVLGNYLGNLQPNWFIGIRTPWTLENPATWRATHRLGGRLMFFGSVALLALQFIVVERTFGFLFVAGILSLTVWGFLYSWNDFRTRRTADRVC